MFIALRHPQRKAKKAASLSLRAAAPAIYLQKLPARKKTAPRGGSTTVPHTRAPTLRPLHRENSTVSPSATHIGISVPVKGWVRPGPCATTSPSQGTSCA